MNNCTPQWGAQVDPARLLCPLPGRLYESQERRDSVSCICIVTGYHKFHVFWVHCLISLGVSFLCSKGELSLSNLIYLKSGLQTLMMRTSPLPPREGLEDEQITLVVLIPPLSNVQAQGKWKPTFMIHAQYLMHIHTLIYIISYPCNYQCLN